MLGRSGLDFVIVDAEHSPLGPETAEAMYRAAEAVGVVALTRVGENTPQVVQKYLDAGSLGVQTPLVNTREEARRAVDAVKYPPQGRRGLASGVRAAGYGLAGPLDEYVAAANAATTVVVQVETVEAASNIDEILAVEGVDVVFMGPTDFSSALGVPGQSRHPKVRGLIEELAGKVNAAGKVAGTLVPELADYEYWRERGVRYFAAGASRFLATAAGEFVAGVREVEQRRG